VWGASLVLLKLDIGESLKVSGVPRVLDQPLQNSGLAAAEWLPSGCLLILVVLSSHFGPSHLSTQQKLV
jgi:hypothetical protein